MPPIMDKMTDRLAGFNMGTLALLHAGYPDRPILIAGDHAIGNPSISSVHRSRHRIEPQTEAGTHPEIEEGNQAAGENDQRRRTPESLRHDPLPDHMRFFSCYLADGRRASRTLQRSSNGTIGTVL